MIIWKPVEGWPLHSVSNTGLIKKGEKILTPSFRENGYKYIGLHYLGKRKKFYIHRLVAMAFIPNPDNHPQVNHIDYNKVNNHAANLEWCTHQYNAIHSFSHGRQAAKGESQRSAKLNNKQVLQLRKMSGEGYSNRALSELFKIDISGIRLIIKRQIWKHI
jgi:hypothetical protein